MGACFAYILQASAVMALLYPCYKVGLASASFHRFNRMLLLIIICISWLLPALPHLFLSTGTKPVEWGALQPIAVPVAEIAPVSSAVSWSRVIVTVWLMGALIVVFFTLIGILRLIKIIHRGAKHNSGKYTVVLSDKAPGPFSWGKWIVMRPKDYTGENRVMIVNHEVVHLDMHHWLDLIPAQLTLCLQWFNPVAWLIMRDIKAVHEFQADAVASVGNKKEYQIMLLKMTVGSSFPTFADSLNHSQITKRITMMMKSESKGSRRLAVLAIPVLAAVSVATLSTSAVADVMDRLSHTKLLSLTGDKGNNSLAIGKNTLVIHTREESAVKSSEVEDQEVDNIVEDKSYGDIVEVQAQAEVAEEAAENAIVTDEVKVAYFVNGQRFTGDLNSIVPSSIQSMEVVKNDPEFPAGKIMITLKSRDVKVAAQQTASFKGGERAMIEFLSENLRYPENVKAEKDEKVIVQFTVNTDGSVSDITALNGNQPEFVEEAKRVVALTGGYWNPAVDNGEAVAVKFVLPVQFKNK